MISLSGPVTDIVGVQYRSACQHTDASINCYWITFRLLSKSILIDIHRTELDFANAVTFVSFNMFDKELNICNNILLQTIKKKMRWYDSKIN